MNSKFDELAKTMNQSVGRLAVLNKIGMSVILLVGLSVIVLAGDTPGRGGTKIAVSGMSDWSIVPASIIPPFVFTGTDGDFYIRHLPLVGKISIDGSDDSIDGKISADFNAELDSTFTGPLWAPVTITATINDSKTILFEGNATGNTVGLVSAGVIKLDGRGQFEGASLEIEFTEIGPGNTDTYNLKGVLIAHSPH